VPSDALRSEWGVATPVHHIPTTVGTRNLTAGTATIYNGLRVHTALGAAAAGVLPAFLFIWGRCSPTRSIVNCGGRVVPQCNPHAVLYTVAAGRVESVCALRRQGGVL
jgi:hypothetical protein